MRIVASGGTISDPEIGSVASGKFGTSSAWITGTERRDKKKAQTVTVRYPFITTCSSAQEKSESLQNSSRGKSLFRFLLLCEKAGEISRATNQHECILRTQRIIGVW